VLQDWVLTDKHPFLMIFMPPQHQKSTMLTEFLPAWAFGQSIDYQALLIMYNSTMAKKYNRKIQRIMDSPEYAAIFPATKLNEKRVVSSAEGSYIKNSEEFEIVGGRGFLKSVGVGGGIAGNPAKLAFLDDLIKNAQEANSLTYRNRTHEWYTDELEARLHNDSKVAFTITRRHEDDQAGRLLKRDGLLEDGGRWKVIKIPAIKVDDTDPNDPREMGDALFPNLHSLERLNYIRKTEPRTFAGLYQQEPKVKGGDMIKGEWFKIMKPSELPFNINYVNFDAVVDGAWTEKVKNDPTAIGYCYHDKRDNILYIRGVKSFRKKISKAIGFIGDDARLNGVTNQSLIHIELKSSGEAFKDFLFQEGFNTDGIDDALVRKGKTTRVNEIESPLRGGRVVLIDEGNWIKPFLAQCEQFPNGKHDDEVDVLCYMVLIYLLTGGNPYILL
jgi:predicted phage terminase large subunit-like protein